jgi:DNA-binding CsgD family transcriptional regulator
MKDLSLRESEILWLVSVGKSKGSIADELGISYYTVRTHLERVNAKLGTHGIAESVAIALRKGIIR